MPQRLANHRTNHNLAQPPLGTEGGRAPGDGRGLWGKRRPDQFFKTAERRRWREGCLQTGATIAATRAVAAVAGDGEAIGVTVRQRDSTQRHFVCHLLPAQGLGVPCAPGINDRRVTHKMCWVRSRKQIEGPGAQLASTVAGDVPPCQPQSGAASIPVPGHFVSRLRRASAKPTNLTPRRWNGVE